MAQRGQQSEHIASSDKRQQAGGLICAMAVILPYHADSQPILQCTRD